jgi:hypothetical protein
MGGTKGNPVPETKKNQVRGNSRSTRKSSQDSLIGSSVKYTQPPSRPVQDPKISYHTLQPESQEAICSNDLYISECQKQSEATINEINKRNYDKIAECLTAYNEELEETVFFRGAR